MGVLEGVADGEGNQEAVPVMERLRETLYVARGLKVDVWVGVRVTLWVRVTDEVSEVRVADTGEGVAVAVGAEAVGVRVRLWEVDATALRLQLGLREADCGLAVPVGVERVNDGDSEGDGVADAVGDAARLRVSDGDGDGGAARPATGGAPPPHLVARGR